MKRCTKCGEIKPFDRYYRGKAADGYRPMCKDCQNARQAQWNRRNADRVRAYPRKHNKATVRAWWDRNPEKRREYARRWRAEHPERWKEINAASRARHSDSNRERSRRNYLKNRERVLAQVKTWQKANPDKRRDYEHRRRARARGAGWESISTRAIYDRDGGRCHICKQDVPKGAATLDHLIPISRGGAHLPANVALAHRACNTRRHAGWIPAQLRLIG